MTELKNSNLVVETKNQFQILVRKKLNEGKGGELFFSEIDEICRQTEYIYAMFQEVDWTTPVVVSGKFGAAISQYKKDGILRMSHWLFEVSGNLRNFPLPQQDYETLKSLKGKPWIFVDDSFYQGRTYTKIANAIGHNATSINVFYNGGYYTPYVNAWYYYYPQLPFDVK